MESCTFLCRTLFTWHWKTISILRLHDITFRSQIPTFCVRRRAAYSAASTPAWYKELPAVVSAGMELGRQARARVERRQAPEAPEPALQDKCRQPWEQEPRSLLTIRKSMGTSESNTRQPRFPTFRFTVYPA